MTLKTIPTSATLVADEASRSMAPLAISVTNSFVDPRATTPSRFGLTFAAGGTSTQAPTSRVDGYQQQATTLSCQEVIGLPSDSTSYVGITTKAKTSGSPVTPLLSSPIIAGRCAGKITSVGGTTYYAALYAVYYNASNAKELEVPIWTGTPATNTWFVAEGFDGQATSATTYVELELRVYGSTSSVTLRATEFVMVVDPEGDVPYYVGGDLSVAGSFSDTGFSGLWTGTADASTSVGQFDPLAVYPAQEFGYNDFNTYAGSLTPRQAIQLMKASGATVNRTLGAVLPVAGTGSLSPLTMPTWTPSGIAYIRKLIAAGLKVITTVTPASWMLANTGDSWPTTTTGQSAYAAAVLDVINTLGPSNVFAIQMSNEPNGAPQFNAGTAGTPTGTTSSGSATITSVSSTVNCWIGQAITGTGIPASSNIIAFTSNTITMNTTATASGTVGLTLKGLTPTTYSACLTAVTQAVHAVYPNIKILAGVLSMGGTQANNSALAWLNTMYANNAQYDWLDLHPYPIATLNGLVGSSGPIAAGGTPTYGLDAGFDATIKAVRDLLAAQGDSARPIFVSEYGVLSANNERTHMQIAALTAGRLRRESPQVKGACLHTLVAKITAGSTSVDAGAVDPKTLRPRPLMHRLAMMNNKRIAPIHSEVIKHDPFTNKATSSGMITANRGTVAEITLANVFTAPSIMFGTWAGATVSTSSPVTGLIFAYSTNKLQQSPTLFSAGAIDDIPVVARGFAGHTANIFEVRDSTNAVLANITSAGTITSASGTTKATTIGNIFNNPGVYFGNTVTSSILGVSTGQLQAGPNGMLVSTSAGAVGLTTKGAASQTANLFEAQTSAAAVVASISPAGKTSTTSLKVGTTSVVGQALTATDTAGNVGFTDVEQAFSSYKRILRYSAIATNATASTYYFYNGANVLSVGGVSTGLAAIYLDPADFSGGSARTAKLRLSGEVITNAVAPAATFTFNLNSVTGWGGVSGATPTITSNGANVYTASALQIVSPAASSQTRISSEVAFPAAGWYVLTLIVSATVTTGASIVITPQLDVRQV